MCQNSDMRPVSIIKIIVFLIISLTSDVTRSEKFLMGYLTGSQRQPGDEEYSRPGLQISGAISLAVSEINTFQPLVNNHTLGFLVAETFGNESESIRQTARLWSEGRVSSYIGPQESCVFEARMAHSFNLPMISYFCAHPETSNKQLFSTFARTRPPDTQISKSVASVLIGFNWRKVVLLYSKSSDRDFSAVARTIHNTLEMYDIQVTQVITWTDTFHYGYTENPFRKIVEQTRDITRIYVIVGFYFEHLGLMLSLEEKNLLKDGQYFVVGVDIEQYDRHHPSRYFKGLLKDDYETVELAEKAFQSYIGVVPTPPIEFEKFSIKVNRFMQMEPFNFPNPTWEWGGLKRVPAEGAYLYDAVYVYARALNDTLKISGNPFDGQLIFSYIKSREYQSSMGYMVHMNAYGDAEGNYTLIGRKMIKSNSKSKYGIFPIGVFLMPKNSSDLPVLNLFDKIDWINQSPPSDEPHCGFSEQKCPKKLWGWTLIPSAIFLLILMLILLIFYRNWMYEQELDSLLWKIDYKDIILSENVPVNAKSKLRYSSQMSLSSAVDLLEFRYCNVYTTIGLYKGRLVSIKNISKKNIEITRKIKKELKSLKDLRHDNLNQFIGATVELPNICIVTDYCSRGSLKDVIQSDVNLDHIFIASMVGDIIRGMIYLHECPIGSHGNLKSSNCLVDSRWVVKISDFGLNELKANCECDEDIALTIEEQCEQLLWKAPELLRDTNSPQNGTQKGDVYSFGIILYEVLSRSEPFNNTLLSYSEIIRRIINVSLNSEPFRPSLDNLKDITYKDNSGKKFIIPESCIWTMGQCWSENPDERPDFKTIRSRLRPMRKGLKNNILDNMLDMMERYTTNLEAIVDERTDQLIQEKRKTEALLYKMLPPSVADSLRRGQSVEAESYDAVTVFFSDIVGFTKLSAQSTPLQVVDFLNDLYTLFDTTLESYDVYKIETIGDAYMVVSGLPIRNEDRHASEIASMAINLLDEIKNFKIRHMPYEKFMMRIGIHTGPVCAGVVGVKMPRYCLFGDTVNTASRLESTSEPLKIHCSEQFKSFLDRLGGYLLFERGNISIKGKYEPMKTYWLVGESEQRKNRRKLLANSDRSRSSLSEILFPMRCKSNRTPEIRSKLVSNQILRHTSPRIRCPSIEGNGERTMKPLLPIIEKSHSSIENLRSNIVYVSTEIPGLYPSKSQYSLNLITCSKDIPLIPTSHSININEYPKDSDLVSPISSPPYKSLNISSNTCVKQLQSEDTESLTQLLKLNNCRNGFTSRRAISLPPSLMQRKVSRSESLPQIHIFETKVITKPNEEMI